MDLRIEQDDLTVVAYYDGANAESEWEFTPTEWNALREYFLDGEHAEQDGEKFAQLGRQIEALKGHQAAAVAAAANQAAEIMTLRGVQRDLLDRLFKALAATAPTASEDW